jgi:hypothetical protein
MTASPHRLGPLPAALLVAALAGCGGNEISSVQDEEEQRDKYCAIVVDIDTEGEEVFADLPANSTPEVIASVEREFVASVSDRLDSLVEAAPPIIRADVVEYVQGLRDIAAGKGSARFLPAEQRLIEYERDVCKSPTLQ